ncbi:MAG: hypothetical protein ACR2HG_01115 [Pyrinomonadaceae bacterium]
MSNRNFDLKIIGAVLMFITFIASNTFAQNEDAQNRMREQFAQETARFWKTLEVAAGAYDPKYAHAVSFTASAAGYEEMREDLDGLYAVCQKYPNLTNGAEARPDDIRDNPVEMCKIAEQREETIEKIKVMVAGHRGNQNSTRWINKINEAMRQPNGRVKDELQTLLFDRPAWEQKEMAGFKKRYEVRGTPPEFIPLFKKADEFKAQITRDAQNRSWTPPPYSDAALEALVKRSYAEQFPGIKIYKIGMTFTTWKSMDDTSLIDIGSDYKLYKTTFGAYRYKLGLTLVKLPNQPLCQIRDFQVQQNKAGAGYSAAKVSLPMGYSGIFVKCP